MPEDSYKSELLFAPEALLSRLMDDEALMRLVIDACQLNLRSQLELFRHQLEVASSEAVRTIHSIKGSALNTDFKALAKLARKIEDGLNAGDVKLACVLLPELSQLVEDTIAAVDGYLARKA